MTRPTRDMYSVGTRSWNKSLIEFTKIRRDERHRSGCSNFSGHEPDVEALFEWMAGYAAESFGKSFRVAVFAAWADLGLVQPRTGFHVASVHSIALRSLTNCSSALDEYKAKLRQGQARVPPLQTERAAFGTAALSVFGPLRLAQQGLRHGFAMH